MENELIVITGSSNRFRIEIKELYDEMIADGKSVVIDSIFHNLTERRGRKQFMRTILDADILLVYNKDGYIGFHTCLEVVMAEVAGIKVEYHFPDLAGRKFISKLKDMYYTFITGD